MALKQDNGKTCTCSAAHPVVEYRPQMHITLNVYCKSLSQTNILKKCKNAQISDFVS